MYFSGFLNLALTFISPHIIQQETRLSLTVLDIATVWVNVSPLILFLFVSQEAGLWESYSISIFIFVCTSSQVG